MKIPLRWETDVEVGMKRYTKPPPYGLIFLLDNKYRYITMIGVRFPLLVLLYDRNGAMIRRFIAYPGEDSIPIPLDTYIMIEIPHIANGSV